ncbi:polymorphic toxin-type HINT domain-containing protein [Streptomyces sp. NPDC002574]|uniref:polymorphic toxin-type HINT domain-containing protein n=1 Tax=Streptomyces sp. NPDC002574 TaxID=3364652 RepID=UPI0036BD3FA9
MAGLLQGFPSPASAADTWQGFPDLPASERPVSGTVGKVKPRPASHTAKVHAPRVAWPTPGTATVDVPAGTEPSGRASAAPSLSTTEAKAAGLPVSVSPARAGKQALRAETAKIPAAQTVGKAKISMLGQDTARAAGIRGVVLTAGRADGATTQGQVGLSLDYSGFADAYGGGYGARLQLVRLPQCALTTPDKAACRTGVPVPSRNDTERQVLTADSVTVPGTAAKTNASAVTVLAATAGTASDKGDYKATSLSASSTWSTNLNTGDFSWSYDMPVPSVPGGLAPDLGLSYSSGSIDGRSSNSNNQASWIGDGFDMWPGYIERRYKPCGDDGIKTDGVEPGDQCWAYDNATISFNGKGGELIPTSTAGLWKLKNDDGTRIERIDGDSTRANGDDNNEYWKVTLPSGIQYFFGYNRLPNWTTSKPETKSVWTAPVFGDDTGDPCHASTFAASWCQQAWRWNLDYVLDPHGNDITYWYTQETNSYGRNLKATDDTPYVRGGYLNRIDYGQRQQDIYSTTKLPAAQVVFGNSERCLEAGSICSDIKTNKFYWYDTPWDLNCDAGTDCTDGRLSPVFFTRKRLTSVTAQTLQSDNTYLPVDSWSFSHHWGMADIDYQLLLDSIQHTGKAGGTLDLPKVTFDYDQLPNRADKPEDGRAPFIKERLGTVDDEYGGQIDVNYKPGTCSVDSPPVPETNTTRCMPQYYQPSNDVAKTLEWFNKYVVDTVIQTDRTGGAPDMVTAYTYLGDAAWHYDDDDGITKEKLKTWSQWRGYAHVRVQTGSDAIKHTQSDHYFLRGMDGDRKDTSGGSKAVTVDDGEGGSITDHESAAGFEYRTETYSKPGGVVLSKTVRAPWHHETAKRVRTWGTATANLIGADLSRDYTSLDDGQGQKWRVTTTDPTYENLAGRITQAQVTHDDGTATCTRTTYPPNTTGIINMPSEVEAVSVGCGTTPVRTTKADGTGSQVLSDIRTLYDGQAWNTAPTKNQSVITETLTGHDGRYATYQDSKATFDSYGRPLTVSDIESTTKYDTTGQTSPVTTQATDTRTTTTSYTPINTNNPRPASMTVTSPPATAGVSASAETTTSYFDALRGLTTGQNDTNSKRTDMVYDPLGRLSKVWLPNRSKTNKDTPNSEYVYHVTANTIVSVESKALRKDGTQESSWTLYDGFLRPRQTQAPGPDSGYLLTDTFYDDRGQSVLGFAPYYAAGTTVTAGKLLSLDDTENVETQTITAYDGLGRPTTVKTAAGSSDQPKLLSTTTTIYGGDRTTVIPPLGATPTTAITDAQGRTSELRQYHNADATGAYDRTTYKYDPAGHMTTLTGPDNAQWTWTYDLQGRQIQAVDPDKGTSDSHYDNRDQLIWTKDSESRQLYYDYDQLGRKLAVHTGSATGLLTASWKYDPSNYEGQLASSSSYRTVGGTQYEYKTAVNFYDNLYRPTRTTTTIPNVPGEEAFPDSLQVNTTYNPDGTLASTSYPGAGNLPNEVIAPTYDALHRVTAITGFLTDVKYSLTGKPLQYTLSTGGPTVQIQNEYEWGTQRLAATRTDRQNVSAAARAVAYTYDQAGNVQAMSDRAGAVHDTQCFTYDYLQRLSKAWTQSTDTCADSPSTSLIGGPAPYWTDYTYNSDGSRQSETQHDPAGNTAKDVTRSYAYDAPHTAHGLSQVTTAGTAPSTEGFTYDNTGNTLTHTSTAGTDSSYAWDAAGHLSMVTQGTLTTDYAYDADGNRLVQHVKDTAQPASEKTVLYLGNTELSLTKGATAPTCTRYYDLDGATAVKTDDGKISFLASDHHDTSDVSIDAATGATSIRRSTPFGAPRGTQPTTWPGSKGFVGGTDDPSGLTHLGAREYDPDNGRFISVDPVLDVTNPQSLNGYAYSNNSPATSADPTGLDYGCGPSAGACLPPDPDANASHCPPFCSADGKPHGPSTGGPHNGGNVNPNGTPGGGGIDAGGGGGGGGGGHREEPQKCSWYDVGCGAKQIWHEHPVLTAVVATAVVVGTVACIATVACGAIALSAAVAVAEASTMGATAAVVAGATTVIAEGGLALGASVTLASGTAAVVVGASKEASPATTRTAATAESVGAKAVKAIGSSPGCKSFTPDTPVLMADGTSKTIGKMEPGDHVATADPGSGKRKGSRPVAAVWKNHDYDLVDLDVRQPSGAVTTIHTTAKHLVWDDTDHKWVPTSKLIAGHALNTNTGNHAIVARVTARPGDRDMYNLTVDDLHTYYVVAGDTPVLVHNCDSTVARFVAGSDGVVDDLKYPVTATERYDRVSQYGGAQTRTPAGRAARAAAEGQACPVCGNTMISGTATRPVPEHDPPLLLHYYRFGGSEMTDAERRAYARTEGISGAACWQCQKEQGLEMMKVSIAIARNLGL